MDGYSDINSMTFTIYRAIPFVFEMSTILEWVTSDTTLLFYDWLKCEDIYTHLYTAKCRNEWIKRQGRAKGDKQPFHEKCTTGVLLFIALAFVIWFPLVIMSSGLPGSAPNPVTSIDFSVGVKGWDPFFTVNLDVPTGQLSSRDFSILRANNPFILPDEVTNTQILSLPVASESPWFISPPGRSGLIAALSTTSPVQIIVQYTLHRLGQINSVISSSYPTPLNSPYRLAQIINNTATNQSVTIPNLFYRYLRLPGVSGNAISQGDTYVSCNLTLERQVVQYNTTQNGQVVTIPILQEWWEIRQFVDPNENAASLFTSPGLEFVSISAQIPTGIASTLVSAGIIGLYVGVVLSIGKFIRLSVTSLTMRIISENIPFCDGLIEMCKDIFIARQSNELLLEEELYWELIQIFRSPETLIEKTKPKRD